jgi:phospholipid transport system substrate-binding protein
MMIKLQITASGQNSMKHPNPLIRHLLGLFLLISPITTPADESGAVALVENFHNNLLNIMQEADKLQFQGRYETLAPVLESSFDTPLIAQVILSRYWSDLSAEQQKQFVDLFNRLSISTYASRFDGYSGETFRTTGVEELKRGRLLVKTEMIRPNDKPVKFDYLVHQNEGNWYIISVIADGINDISLKRAEYVAIISNKGFDKLVNEIENKIRQLREPVTDT